MNALAFLAPDALRALEEWIEARIEEAVERRMAEERSKQGRSVSPFMTVEEAAEFLRCGRGSIDNMLSAGELTREKRGRKTLLRRAEIEALVITDRERRS